MFEADVSGAGEGGAGVGARSGGLAAGVAGGRGRGGVVAGVVVGVPLRPSLGVDGGDSAHAVEIEGAGARQPVHDRGQVAVGAVGVGAAVDVAVPGGDLLRGEPSGFVPGRGHGDRVAEDAGELPAGGVVCEVDPVIAAGQAVG